MITNGHLERGAAGTSPAPRQTALLAAIVDGSEEAIFATTREGTIVSWNRGAERMYGYSMEEVIGRSLSLLFPLDRLDESLRLIAQVATDPRVEPFETLRLRKNGSRAAVLLSVSPIRNLAGQIAGAAFIAQEMDERRPAEEHLHRMNDKLIERIRGLEQSNRELNLVQELSTLLQTCGSAAEMHGVIAESLQRFAPAGSGALYLFNDSVNLVESAARWGDPSFKEAAFDPQQCWALRRGHIHAVPAFDPSPRCSHLPGGLSRSSICVPLFAASEILGVLSVQGSPYENSQSKSAQERLFAARQKLLETIGGQIALAVANLKLRERLQTQSVRDALTGLFNRRYLDETLAREVHRSNRDARELSIIVCDFDQFKSFNDTHGHATGDSLLRAFGDLIRKIVRAGDVACRYGGDEFVLILVDTILETAKRRAELLQREFQRLRVPLGEQLLKPGTLSLGISSFPTHGQTGGALFRVADQALYRAKSEGGNRAVVGQALENSVGKGFSPGL